MRWMEGDLHLADGSEALTAYRWLTWPAVNRKFWSGSCGAGVVMRGSMPVDPEVGAGYGPASAMSHFLRLLHPDPEVTGLRRRLQRMACLGGVVFLSWFGIAGAQDADSDNEADPGEEAESLSTWTESDTRLANHYLQLLQQNPEYGNVLTLLWQLYEKHDQTGLLLEYLKGAAEQQPGSVVAVILHGHLLRKNEQFDEAREAYGLVLEKEPENLIALRGAAEINEQQGRMAKALALYRRLVELSPSIDTEDAVAIRLRQASLLRESEQLDEAAVIWNELLAARPTDTRLRSEIVAQLIESGRTEDAIAALEGLAEDRDPAQRLTSLDSLARLYEFIGDFDQASVSMREAMGILHFKHHQFASLFERLVRLHERFDRLPELESGLEEEASRENPSERSVFLMAEFYRLTANPSREETWIRRLAELVPGNVDYRLRLVDTQMENDQYAAAAETLDGVLSSQADPPLALILLRSRIALNLEGREAAEAVIDAMLARGSNRDLDTLRRVLDFARKHYLDSLVERLLGGEDGQRIASGGDNESAPMELARFFHERGRTRQAEKALRDYVAEAEGSPILKAARLAEVTAAFRELNLSEAAMDAIEEAISLAPENTDFQMARAEIFIDRKETEKAIAALEQIWQAVSEFKVRTEIDQRLFSLMRGMSDEPAAPGAGAGTGGGPGFTGPPRTMEEFRRLSAIANRSVRAADDPPPRRLMDFYDAVKEAAEESPSLATRYRAGWWASKLQDTAEASYQLNTAREEAGGEPVVEIEKLLLSLFELYEQYPQMARQLEKLAEIDPDNARDYRQRWAEMRFLLGYEDEAIRTLEELAKSPEVSLNTLKTLASLYQKQGRTQAQVAVWQDAYRRGNVFEKRKIIKQLSTTLIELGRHEEALKMQLDLMERETDLVQKRKQFDSQLSVATRHFLIDWMATRYRELAQQNPFDRFYPEALARVLRAKGDYDDAFVAMKRAYYMSGQDRDLLEDLGELAGLTKDLKAAIYYRRQMIALNEEEASPEAWRSLIEMMERDLRVGEADQIRERLEGKFTQDADFLVQVATLYRKEGRLADAERVLDRLTSLRPWDAASWLTYGLILNWRGKEADALAAFEKAIEETEESAVVAAKGKGVRSWPVIATGRLGVAVDVTDADSNAMASMVRAMSDYPYVDGEVQESIVTWLERGHSEFQLVPGGLPDIRLRAIEEAARLHGRAEADREAWVARWQAAEGVSSTEKLWAFRFAGAGDPTLAQLKQAVAERPTPLVEFLTCVVALRVGEAEALMAWVSEPDETRSGSASDRQVLALLALATVLRQPADAADQEIAPEEIATVLRPMTLTAPVASYLFDSIRENSRPEATLAFGRALVEEASADHPELLLDLAQVAGDLGRDAERLDWLHRCVAGLQPLRAAGLPYYYFQAVSQLYHELESATERRDLIAELRDRFDRHPGARQEVKLENEATLALIEDDGDAATEAIRALVNRHLDQGRPDRPALDGDAYMDSWGWAQVERLLHAFASRRPQPTDAQSFFAALSPAIGPDPRNRDAVANYEQFEMERVSWMLESLTPPERAVEVQSLYSRLRDAGSHLQLARTLESRGLHREAIPIYRQVIDETPEEISPARGFFGACLKAGEFAPALALIEAYLSGEVREPAGMTPDFVFRQHADFLLMAGEIEALTARCLVPEAETGRAVNSLPGFGFATDEGLDRTVYYQNALVRAHERRGNDPATLRVLTHLRDQGRLTEEQRWLAGSLLEKSGDREGALEWWSLITLDQQQPSIEAEAIRALAELHATADPPDRTALGDLARASRDYDSLSLVGDVAAHLFAAGMETEGRSLLLMSARDEQRETADRSRVLGQLVHLRFGAGDSVSECADDIQALLENLPDEEKALREWLRLVVEHGPVGSDDETGRNGWEAVLAPHREVPEKRLAVLLVESRWRGELAGEDPSWVEELTPRELDRVIELLPELGADGIEASRQLLADRVESVATLCEGDRERQVRLLGQLGDRMRAAEIASRLLQEAETDGFQQFSLRRRASSVFAERWHLPAVFEEAGFPDLAGALYDRYHRTIRRLTFEHGPFLANYSRYLMDRSEFAKAERILVPAYQKSIGADPQLLVDLYRQWGKLDEMDVRLAGAYLTPGTQVRLDERRVVGETDRPSR